MVRSLILIAPSLMAWAENPEAFGEFDLASEIINGGNAQSSDVFVLFPGKERESLLYRLDLSHALDGLRTGVYSQVVIAGDNPHHVIQRVLGAIRISKASLVNKADEGSILFDTLQGFQRLSGDGTRV